MYVCNYVYCVWVGEGDGLGVEMADASWERHTLLKTDWSWSAHRHTNRHTDRHTKVKTVYK